MRTNCIYLAIALSCSSFVHGESQPTRGDLLVEAVHSDDIVQLNKLLVPEDKEENFYQLSDNPDIQYPMDQLYLEIPKEESKAAEVLVAHGVGRKISNYSAAIQNTKQFSERYPNFKSTLGPKYLSHACKTGNEKILKAMLQIGVTPVADNLRDAVVNNKASVVEILIKAGCAASAKISHGKTELSLEEYAQTSMHFGVLEALGKWENHSDKLQRFREGKPSGEGLPYLGEWIFDKQEITIDLRPDGTGVVKSQRTNLPSPVFWRTRQESKGLLIIIEPPPGHHPFKWIPLKAADDKLSIVLKGGFDPGKLINIDEEQIRGLVYSKVRAINQYGGPAGRWIYFNPTSDGSRTAQFLLEIEKSGKISTKIGGHSTEGALIPFSANKFRAVMAGEGGSQMIEWDPENDQLILKDLDGEEGDDITLQRDNIEITPIQKKDLDRK